MAKKARIRLVALFILIVTGCAFISEPDVGTSATGPEVFQDDSEFDPEAPNSDGTNSSAQDSDRGQGAGVSENYAEDNDSLGAPDENLDAGFSEILDDMGTDTGTQTENDASLENESDVD